MSINFVEVAQPRIVHIGRFACRKVSCMAETQVTVLIKWIVQGFLEPLVLEIPGIVISFLGVQEQRKQNLKF